MEGFSTAVKEHLKDKTSAYFFSLWVFGLEELVGGCVEMETCMQEANPPTSCVTVPIAALLVVLQLVVLVVLQQVTLTNHRAKDCREQGG